MNRFNEAAGFTRRKRQRAIRAIVASGRVASMRPPDLPGGNAPCRWRLSRAEVSAASMRPPDLPGGNVLAIVILRGLIICASMRPPDLPGGNQQDEEAAVSVVVGASMRPPDLPGGNTAARTYGVPVFIASMRPPDLPGGNKDTTSALTAERLRASMRPPDLPGGNGAAWLSRHRIARRFNEAAGFTRRKRGPHRKVLYTTCCCFNEAAGFTRRKRADSVHGAALANGASMRPPDLPGGNDEL